MPCDIQKQNDIRMDVVAVNNSSSRENLYTVIIYADASSAAAVTPRF